MTILENMSLADTKGKPFNLRWGTNRKRIDFYRENLKLLGLGLEDKLDVKAGVLSGGQRQAMALLMSTMTPIEFLILDEHTAALDPKTAEIIMELTDKDCEGEKADYNHGHPQSQICGRVRQPPSHDAPGSGSHGQKCRGKIRREGRGYSRKDNEISIECGN